jgi:hypothetical protein
MHLFTFLTGILPTTESNALVTVGASWSPADFVLPDKTHERNSTLYISNIPYQRVKSAINSTDTDLQIRMLGEYLLSRGQRRLMAHSPSDKWFAEVQ